MEAVLESLPILETPCPRCEGVGNSDEMFAPSFGCPKCNGAGYIPTEDGKRLLSLVRHNFRGLFNRMEEGL